MRALWQDLRFAARSLGRTPGFTVAAIATLALGIGANTTIFSLADALFLHELDVPDARHIVHINGTIARRPDSYPLSLADYAYYRERARTFRELAAHYPGAPLSLVVDGEPTSVIGSVVTANYFAALRLTPAAGRFFVAAEDSATAEPAVVISYDIAERLFAGAAVADVVGRHVAINGSQFTIIGIAPAGFDGVIGGAAASAVWLPSGMFRIGYRYCAVASRDCTIVQMLGRLASDATTRDAQAELDVLARQLAAAFPETNRDRGVRVVAARGAMVRVDQSRLVGLLSGAVGLLLLIACANLSGLLLARGLRRRKEIAIRIALGATRARLVRHLLTESVLVAVAGGTAGAIAAVWGKDLIESLYNSDYAGRPLNFSLVIGWEVLAGTFLLALMSGVIAGLAPALEGRRADVMGVLRDEGTGSGVSRTRLRNVLVVSQVALSVTLLVGAGLVLRSSHALRSGRAFDLDKVAVLRLRPSLVGYDSVQAWRFQREVVRRLESLPGVDAVSLSEGIPAFGGGAEVYVASTASSGSIDSVRTPTSRVGSGFFATLGAALIDGREFSDRDVAGAPHVAILNDVLAERLWPRQRATGRIVRIDGIAHQIVGVVRDLQAYSLTETPQPYLFRSYWQQDDRSSWQLDSRTHVRVTGAPQTMLPLLRREIAAIDPTVPISEDYALADRLGYTFQPVRVAGRLLVSFAVLAMLLSTIGLYTVLAFAVNQRTREIAIRSALGASRSEIARLVLGQSARLSVTGALLGVGIAVAGARLLASLLYGVPAHDIIAFTAAPLSLVAMSLVASYVPVRRALRIDHVVTLRHE